MFPLHVAALLVDGAPALAEPRVVVTLGCGAISHHGRSCEYGIVGISRFLEPRTVSDLRDSAAHLSTFRNAGPGGGRRIHVGRGIGYLLSSRNRDHVVAAFQEQAAAHTGDDWRRAGLGKDSGRCPGRGCSARGRTRPRGGRSHGRPQGAWR